MRLLGMDTCPSLNDIMEIRCNNVLEASRGTIFKPAELHALWIISNSGADPGFCVRGDESRRGVWGPLKVSSESRAEPW